MHPQVTVLGYSQAAMYLRGTPTPDVRAIISIHGQREFGVEATVPHRLDLLFDDVDIDISPSRRRWNESNGKFEVPPSMKDAEAIIKFAESIRDVGGVLLCHCGVGVSRGPAAALICLAVWNGQGCEAQCMKELLQIRRGAFPHHGLIHYADELLKRKGGLLAAVKSARR